MRAEKIKKKFQEYVDNLGDPSVFRKYSSDVAALFGSDLIEVDEAKSCIKLPDFGWVRIPSVPLKKSLGWVAVIKEGENYEIAFGRRGVSPFSEEAGEFLPKAEGVILAMPFFNSDKIRENMIAT